MKTMVADFTRVDRAAMEKVLDLILDIAHGMIAHFDTADGDADLEPSLGYHPPDLDPRLVDAEGTPQLMPENKKAPPAGGNG